MRNALYILVFIGLVCITVACFLYDQYFSGIVSIMLLVTYTAFLSWASSNIRSNVFLKSTSQVDKGKLAITFDDGPSDVTNEFLDVLQKHNVSATFFLIGKKIQGNEEIVKRIVADGHAIGSHSHRHDYLYAVKSSKIIENDLVVCSAAIEQVTGIKPQLFRPPFGVTTPRLASAVKRLGLYSVGWTIRTNDGVELDPRKIEDNIFKKELSGSIVLFHDTNRKSLEPLKKLIATTKELGIEIVSLQNEVIGYV
jgi:peptidoglycan-N-acetylglucosamine deacetylase